MLILTLSSRAQTRRFHLRVERLHARTKGAATKRCHEDQADTDSTQYQQVSANQSGIRPKGEEIMNSGGGKFAKYRKFKSMMSDKDKKMKKVLNPAQYTSYEEMKKEMNGQGEGSL